MAPAWWKTIIDGLHQNETQSGAGTISPDKTLVLLTTTGADALVVGDGEAGQHLIIVMEADGGDGTILAATTSLVTYISIVFGDVGDWVCLRFNGRAWVVVAFRGVTLT